MKKNSRNCTNWVHKKFWSEREIDMSIHTFQVGDKTYTFSRDNEVANFVYPAKSVAGKIKQITEDLLAGMTLSKTGYLALTGQ
jgi:hypothetical protein